MENSTKEKTVKTFETTPPSKSLLNRTVEDLLLDEMSLPLILNNLKKRLLKNRKFTLLLEYIDFNKPYKRLDLYGAANIRRY